jgi:cytosine/adenosine deaminase-related metal-dependent hydrolase
MFNRTAPIQKLKSRVRIALGSDSTLTGSPTLLDEMKVAFRTGLAGSRQIYDMVTHLPAEIFRLPMGSLTALQTADFFVAPRKVGDYFENLMHVDPGDVALVMSHGKLKLLDADAGQWKPLRNAMKVQGRLKYISPDVALLKKRIERKTGTSNLEANPLWKLIEV